MAFPFFCTVCYIIPLTAEVHRHICTDHYRYSGGSMNSFNVAEAQKFLRQNADLPAQKLRRQAAGAALALLIGGGNGLYHVTSARSAEPENVAAAAAPVSVETLKSQTVRPFAQFSGRINAVDYAEIRPQVAGRITE